MGRRLFLESLEPRLLLSGAPGPVFAEVTDGNLNVSGSPGNDTVTVLMDSTRPVDFSFTSQSVEREYFFDIAANGGGLG